jgi:hypothetical protein
MKKFVLIAVYNSGEVFCTYEFALSVEDICKMVCAKQEKAHRTSTPHNNDSINWRLSGAIYIFYENEGYIEGHPRGEIKFSKDGITCEYDEIPTQSKK